VDHFAGDPRSNDERMVAGDLDIADDPAILEEQARAVRLMARFRAAYDEDPGGRAGGGTGAVRAPGRERVRQGARARGLRQPGLVGPGTFINVGLTPARSRSATTRGSAVG